MSKEPEYFAHQEWIGYVQPVGLVVSIPALLTAQCYLNKNILLEQQTFQDCLRSDKNGSHVPEIDNIQHVLSNVLGWLPTDLLSINDPGVLPSIQHLEVVLPEYQETLRPDFVVPDFRPADPTRPWLMLIQSLDSDVQMDEVCAQNHLWQATPQSKFERLLRETDVPIGILTNHSVIRLIYAPRGESSGYVTFNVSEMVTVAGRPIFAAFHMLLNNEQLFLKPENQRLNAILVQSRKYQNTVSNRLAQQVLDSLYELLRGFQYANEQVQGELLSELLKSHPDSIYAGLLTVLMRLVFVLYAEDRDLLSTDPIYVNYYSVSALLERLREDFGRHPDTMDQRFGAWAQLLTLFRIIFDGGHHKGLNIPARKGHLFDPERYPFLEGRSYGLIEQTNTQLPLISDGVIFRVLSNLLVLEGEKLSYRTLDVEQIGSVYEAVMGFSLEVAQGLSVAIKSKKPHGAPTVVNLEEILAVKPKDRAKTLKLLTDQDFSGSVEKSIQSATGPEDLLLALEKKIANRATPQMVPKGNMVLQPSNERRKSGSHYTPRLLTAPIVTTTLKPIIEKLGLNPTPSQILDIKICDPTMGSAAFLVEACRQLGDELVQAWHQTNTLPAIPPDEDEILHARRIVAQRCLYGVDKNPMAVDLAKLSLWLATLAKDHPFTFLDHNLRCGDSLLGLTREQIMRLHWQPKAQRQIDEKPVKACLDQSTAYRKYILDSSENTLYPILQVKLSEADKSIEIVRAAGDSILAAFLGADNTRDREQKRFSLVPIITTYIQKLPTVKSIPDINSKKLTLSAEAQISELRSQIRGMVPFHWQIEFPEVFERLNGGFDCIVGNPPFMGGSKLSSTMGKAYLAWLSAAFPETKGKSDLVAYFYRASYELLRIGGTFGLLATNSIAQGDTRYTGLRWLRNHGADIYCADRRRTWPGIAAVVVSVVHVKKQVGYEFQRLLDGKPVDQITAYLIHFGPDENPDCLNINSELVHSGTNINGKGFVLTPEERKFFIDRDPSATNRILPYLGAVEMNESPTCAPNRFVINMENFTEPDVKKFPDLYKHLSETVRLQRQKSSETRLREQWWTYSRPAKALYSAVSEMKVVLASGRAGGHICFAFQPTKTIFSDSLTLFLFEDLAGFCVLQSRVHEVWARLMGSSLKDDARYIPEDCFETFPFPEKFASDVDLKEAGRNYYDYRAQIMVERNEGLTAIYNRFHNPTELSTDILELRKLHDAIDKSVLKSYGWADLAQTCDFILDYEDTDEDDDEQSTRREPWRYRWTNNLRDDVLVRLLELNKERFVAQKIKGAPNRPNKKKVAVAVPKAEKKISQSKQTEQNEQLKVLSTLDTQDQK